MLSLALGGGVLAVVRLTTGGPQSSGPQDSGPSGRLPSGRGPASGDPDAAARSDSRERAAAALLATLQRRLVSGTRRQVAALGGTDDRGARRELSTLRRNLRVLRVTDLRLRYLGDGTRRLTSSQQQALPPGAWVAEVRLRWRLRGFDDHPSVRVVPVTLAAAGRGARFLTLRRGYGAELPLWVTDRVHVTRTPLSLVLATRPDRSAALAPLADRAVRDVRRVLGGWRGRLVVEAPADRTGLTRVLGSRPGGYRGIAAVTTTVDGSDDAAAPEHIFVNPPVFDPLGDRGSQVVLSHEATHVATAAAASSMPTWLVEGFADYVALRDVDLPVRVTAGQVLARVRRAGPPARLPGAAEFDARGPGLGASYEAAWLACRLLVRTYGERRLVAFYRAADRESSTTEAFRTVLGTDQRTFTRAWRADLRRLAG